MLKSTYRISVSADATHGFTAAPDAAILPFQIRVQCKTPTELPARIEALLGHLRRRGETELQNYKSHTEKLMGRGVLGRGVRHHASVSGFVTCPFEASDDYLGRLHKLESLRQNLEALRDEMERDEGEYRLGEASFVVDPEPHRASLAQHVMKQARDTAQAMEMNVAGVELSPNIGVDIVGPDVARLSMQATLTLSAEN